MMIVAALLALSLGIACAQSSYSTCNSGSVNLKIVEADALPVACANTSGNAANTLVFTYGCITDVSATLDGCNLKMSSRVPYSTTKFPCFAVDFTGPLVSEEVANLAGTINNISAQLSFCATNTAACATLTQQQSMAINFVRNGSSYFFNSGNCSYKYEVVSGSKTFMVKGANSANASSPTPAAATTPTTANTTSKNGAPCIFSQSALSVLLVLAALLL